MQTRDSNTVEESRVMPNLRQVEQEILANGRVDDHELAALRRQLYAGGKINRRGADFLVELHKRVEHRTPAFEHFFYQAVKDHVLADGRIGVEEATWLRQLLTSGRWIKDEDRRLLHELRGEAREVSPEFQALFAESMKRPQEKHTSG
jgi:hypothetical protein